MKLKEKSSIRFILLFVLISLAALLVLAADPDLYHVWSASPFHNVDNAMLSGNVVMGAFFNDVNVTAVNFSWVQGATTIYTLNLVNSTNVSGGGGSRTLNNLNLTNSSFATATYVPDGLYNITITAASSNGTVATNSTVNVTIDNTAPIATFDNPANNSNYSTGMILLNASIVDNNSISFVFFEYDNYTGADHNISAQNQSGVWNASLNAAGLIEGSHWIRVAVNDSRNNTARGREVNISINVDRTVPQILIRNATNFNTTFNLSAYTPGIVFNFTDNVFKIASCTVYLNNSNGVTTTAATNVTTINNTNSVAIFSSAVADGTYKVLVMCTDYSSNVGNTTQAILNITVDSTPPRINLNTSSYSTINKTPWFKFNFSENMYAGTTNCTLWMNGVAYAKNSTTPNGTSTTLKTNTTLDDGAYSTSINCTDQLGNQGSATITVTVDQSPPAPYGATSTSTTLTVYTADSATCRYSASSGQVYSGMSAFGTTGGTQHIASSLSSGTAYYVKCRDDLGNTDGSDISITTTEAESGNSGGSGGSSGGTSSGVTGNFAQETWVSINAGETASVPVENGEIGVTELSFAVSKAAYGAWAKVEKVSSFPTNVDPFIGMTYKNIRITENNIEEVLQDKATVDFKVLKSWLSDNKVGKGYIAMFRFVDDAWVELPTSIGEDDGTYIHYKAYTPGFSYFVIGVKEGVVELAEAAAEQEVAAGTLPPSLEEETGVEAGAAETTTKKAIWPWVVLVVVIVVVLAALYLLKKKRR